MDTNQYNNLVQDVIKTMVGDREFTLEEALHFEILTEQDVLDILENILVEDDAYTPYSPEERKKRSWLGSLARKGIGLLGKGSESEKKFTPQELIGDRVGLQGLQGAPLKAKASKIIQRRTMFHAAKMGVDAPKETIRQELISKGLRDKLKSKGISTKVRVKVDRETGQYVVTDATGKRHVIEKLIFARRDGKLVLESRST